MLVNIGVLVLRRTRPDMPRPYRVPFAPVLPLLGIVFAVYLMIDLPGSTWLRFGLWLLAGLLIYAVYATATPASASSRDPGVTPPE